MKEERCSRSLLDLDFGDSFFAASGILPGLTITAIACDAGALQTHGLGPISLGRSEGDRASNIAVIVGIRTSAVWLALNLDVKIVHELLRGGLRRDLIVAIIASTGGHPQAD